MKSALTSFAGVVALAGSAGCYPSAQRVPAKPSLLCVGQEWSAGVAQRLGDDLAACVDEVRQQMLDGLTCVSSGDQACPQDSVAIQNACRKQIEKLVSVMVAMSQTCEE